MLAFGRLVSNACVYQYAGLANESIDELHFVCKIPAEHETYD
jgi:hypothetical protein